MGRRFPEAVSTLPPLRDSPTESCTLRVARGSQFKGGVLHRFLVLPILLVHLLAHAEPARNSEPIRLREAVLRAVRNSPALAQSGAAVDVAHGQLEATRGLDDLLLDASLSWLELRRPLVAGSPVQQPAFDDVLAAISLTQPLPTGGRLGLRLGTEYSRTEYATALGMSGAMSMDLARSISIAVAPSLQVFLQHPLLRGFGWRTARALRRRAEVRWDAARLSRAAAVATQLRDIASTYWDLYYAAQELRIRRAAADSAREQLRRVNAQIEVGKQPPSAAAEVEVTIALREESTLLAEQSLVERSIELERLLGQPASAERWLEAADAPLLERAPPEPGEALRETLLRSPQLALARTQGRAAQIEVEVTANGLLPQLDFNLSGGTVGNAAEAGVAFAQLGQPGSYSVTAGLTFQLPLQNRAARGARAAALQGLRMARLDEAEVRNQLAAGVARLCALARFAGQRADVLARSTDAAALDLAAERARFEVGRASNFDVLRRQEEVALVQLGQARARVEQAKALAALAALSGRILDQFGVDVR